MKKFFYKLIYLILLFEDFHFYITIELVLTHTFKMSTFTYDETPYFGLKKEIR